MVADFTVAQGVVVDGTTNIPIKNGSGVLRDQAGGNVQNMYDLLGNPIANIPVNDYGVHSPFKMDIPRGTLDFGSVLLPVKSLEADDALPFAIEARDNANSARTAATAAVTAAEKAAADVKRVIDEAGGFGIGGGIFVDPDTGRYYVGSASSGGSAPEADMDDGIF